MRLRAMGNSAMTVLANGFRRFFHPTPAPGDDAMSGVGATVHPQNGWGQGLSTVAVVPGSDEVATMGMLACCPRNNESTQPADARMDGEGAVDYALLSAINHDVRTPLTGILGALELLDYSELTVEQRALVRNAEGSSRKLQGILDDVLALAKLEAGTASREHLPFDPREVVGTALAKTDRDVDVVTMLDEALASRLLGDGSALRQALSKLVAHAISRKLGKPWRFEVRVQAQGDSWQSIEFVLETRPDTDTIESPPAPMPTDVRRADELAWIAACKFCEWMGLTLQEQGRGWAQPRFVVRGCFPLAQGSSPREFGSGATRRLPSPREGGAAILVAEDHELVREVIGRQLAALGWACDLVGDGESALRMLAQREYALLITDRYMPKMDGLELVRRIRGAEDGSPMPIVLLTANLPESEHEALLDIGIDEVICKPTSVSSLSRVLSRWTTEDHDRGRGEESHPTVLATDDAREIIGRLRAVFDGDTSSVDDYLHLLRKEQARLRRRLEEGDPDRIREVAHSLSGMGSFFGAHSLAGLATSVERGEEAAFVLGRARELSAYLVELVDSLQTNAREFSAFTSNTNPVSDGSHRKVSSAALEI